MNYDPDEDVTLNGAKMSLRSAVAKVMALSPDDRMGPRFLEMASRRSWTARRSKTLRIYRVSKIIPESGGAEHASESQNGNGSPAPGRTHGGPTMFARIGARAHRFVK
jgi:hypothetical protein